MKSKEEDVESRAQLLKESRPSSSEEFDFDDAEDSNHHWTTHHKRVSKCEQLWRTLQSIPIPNWLPIRRLNQLNPRYIIFAVAVSLIITAFIFNPYTPSRPTSHESSVHFQPTTTKSGVAGATATSNAWPTNAHKYKPYERPAPEHNDKFCTTWPVDNNGKYELNAGDRVSDFRIDSMAPKGGWRKPEGLKVIAMVFYGRKRYVDILDCYLQKNLKSHGGYLDEVWFMAHTQDKDDIAWVEGLVLDNPNYKIVGQGVCEEEKYKCLWEYATDDKTIYIKIDDDIIYIHPDAIPQLVHTRLAVPHAYAVSANLVNSPITGLEQYHHGAIHPFTPDQSSKPQGYAAETWRTSKIKKFPAKELDDIKNKNDKQIMFPESSYRGAPFLLISEDHHDLLHTPLGRYDQNPGEDFIAFSPAWKSWAIAGQQQYSLLYNLEKNWMHRYFFGRAPIYAPDAKGPNKNKIIPNPPGAPGGEQVFDTQFRRYNLNFCAVWGSDIKEQLPIADDDEDDITNLIPKRTGRPFIIDTKSVVAHFSFFTQTEGVTRTDLLDRWRAFANEAVCELTNLKVPWDLMCPKFKVEGALGGILGLG